MTQSNRSLAFIYLASQSPRRSQLLRDWGIPHQILKLEHLQNAEELETPLPQENPVNYVQRVCQLKIQAAIEAARIQQLPPAPILCADTTVAFQGEILGKPTDAQHAHSILSCLSNQIHEVHTALALASCTNETSKNYRIDSMLQTSSLKFAALSEQDIQFYIQTQEPFGKAGAYGIQGLASLWIEWIRGSYSGIMGLPAYETTQLLKRAGISHV